MLATGKFGDSHLIANIDAPVECAQRIGHAGLIIVQFFKTELSQLRLVATVPLRPGVLHLGQRPFVFGFHQPLKAATGTVEEVFGPRRAFLILAHHQTDDAVFAVVDLAHHPQLQRGVHLFDAFCRLHHFRLRAGGVDLGMTGRAVQMFRQARRVFDTAPAGGTVQRFHLATEACCAVLDGVIVTQQLALQVFQLDRLPDIGADFVVRIVERQELLVEAEIGHLDFIATTDLEWQFALATDAFTVPHFGGNEAVTLELDRIADLQRRKGRHPVLRYFALGGEGEQAGRVAQPAGFAIVEHAVPLVPHAGAVTQLDAANQRKRAVAVTARCADLER